MNVRIVKARDDLAAVTVNHLDGRSEAPGALVEHTLYRVVTDKQTTADGMLRVKRRDVRVDKKRLHRWRFFGVRFRAPTPTYSRTSLPRVPVCSFSDRR